MSSVEATIFPDKRIIKVGKIEFSAGHAEIRGKYFPNAIEFALLAIIEERALDLLEKINTADLRDCAKSNLMRLAISKGVEAVERLLEKYLSERPSQATLFKEYKWASHRLSVGDGERFVEVETCLPSNILNSLPENVYKDPIYVKSFPDITKEMFEEIRRDPADFLKFALRVAKIEKSGYLSSPAPLRMACREYFEDRQRAEKILRKIEEEVDFISVGSSLLRKAEEHGLIEVADGYLIFLWSSHNIYFVDNHGGVYLLSRKERTRERKAVGYLAVKGKVPPGSRKKAASESDLKLIARIVGEKRPDLAVIIAP
ncbi:MAG: hypothetical protein QXG35_09085 [Nitrososphaerota archaeon]